MVSTVHSDYRLDYLGRPAAALTYGKLNVLALRHIKYHIGVSDAMRALLISARLSPRHHLLPSTTASTSPGSVPQPRPARPSTRAWARMWPAGTWSSAPPPGSTR